MVLEVNNTFDERRPYLVFRDLAAVSDPTEMASDRRPRIKAYQVMKDFQVSPFNSRNGHYSVLASDPLGPDMNGWRGIDVTITLNSSKGHAKLVARLFSDGQVVDPMALSPLHKLTFLARWFWVGFATFPRIIKEALVLFFRRKLRILDIPMPLVKTLGRHATSVEVKLELCFRHYIEFLVGQSEQPLSLRYFTSGFSSSPEEVFTSPPGKEGSNNECKILELSILTPAFYSRFIQYADCLDAMTAELNDGKTIWVNQPELLLDVFSVRKSIAPSKTSLSCSSFIFVHLLRYMRQNTPTVASASACTDKLHMSKNGTPLEANRTYIDQSEMDAYMISCRDWCQKRKYISASIQQMLSDRYFIGRLDLLHFVTQLIRLGIAWACASALVHIATSTHKL